jgi:cell fate regulator YaaT (PSP1 superfamily)
MENEDIKQLPNDSMETPSDNQESNKAFDENFEVLEKEEERIGDADNTFFDDELSFGKSSYNPSVFIQRGCNKCPQAYTPISKRELEQCSKLNVHNWMNKINIPFHEDGFDCVEVRFKNSHKDFYRIPEGLEIEEGDVVAVEGTPGHDIGIVALCGELCRVQMRKKKISPSSESIKKLYRRAKVSDIEKWCQVMEKEDFTLFETRRLASYYDLDMKINDVEYQGDGAKAIFYYTANDRVDFRQLIKALADEFHVKIEMKQIGARQEASKLGGIGTCGRELCCCTWMNNFQSVSTSSAKVQQLVSNPQKLAGQCGKLKCCLNYEYDVYADALKSFPNNTIDLYTKKGKAHHYKTDVFQNIMWYSYYDSHELIPLSSDSVKKIIADNKSHKQVDDLETYSIKLDEKSDEANIDNKVNF